MFWIAKVRTTKYSATHQPSWNAGEYFWMINNTEFPQPPLPSANPILDDILAKVWKTLEHSGAKFLNVLFNQIVKEGGARKAVTISITVPIWKGKGNVCMCSNCMSSTFMSHDEDFECCLNCCFCNICSDTSNPCGFVWGCGTPDTFPQARLLVERHSEKNKSIYMAFLALEMAFDKIQHEIIWHTPRHHSIHEAYVHWIQLYNNVTISVWSTDGNSQPFAISVGVH